MKSEAEIFAPKISIIIPVYNGSNYLREAIDSALAQTYSNFEIIVVDDGSKDDGATRAIAESYGSRITYIWQENGGCGAALNTGIAAMSGEYFSWLSHDDLYLPEKLASQVEILKNLPNKKTIIYGNYEIIDAKSSHLHTMQMETLGSPEQLNFPLYPLTRGIIHGCALLIPRSLFEQHGAFNPALKTTQDYDLWFRLLRHASLQFSPQIFVRSRVHDKQSSRTLPAMKTEGDALWARFVTEVTPDEAEVMDGSHYRYLVRIADFLLQTPYADVEPIARAKAQAVLTDTLVTVVIPFRDRTAWTVEALTSVLAQTHRALEIILVDDGSMGDTGALKAIAGTDERVVYFRQDWQGASAARNAGIKRASGRYVAFLDSDDRWSPDKVERQLRHMEENGLKFSHTGYMRFDEKTGETTNVATDYFSGQVYPRIIAFCPVATPTVMVRAEILRSNPFPEGIQIGEDIITWTSIAQNHELGALSAHLTTVRVSEGTTSTSAEKSQRGILNILSWVVGHPQHGDKHREILALIDLVRRYELERRPVTPPHDAAEALPGAAISTSSQRPRLLSDHLRIGWYLAMRGFESVRQYGVRATWARIKSWRQAHHH